MTPDEWLKQELKEIDKLELPKPFDLVLITCANFEAIRRAGMSYEQAKENFITLANIQKNFNSRTAGNSP